MNKINFLLNIAISLTAIWIFKIYGDLVTWWGHVFRSQVGQASEKSTFFAHADRLHIAAIILLLLNALASVVLLKEKCGRQIEAFIAMGIAIVGLLLCLLVSF